MRPLLPISSFAARVAHLQTNQDTQRVGSRLIDSDPILCSHELYGTPQVGAGSLGFCGFSMFSVCLVVFLGLRPDLLLSRPHFRVCVLVVVFLLTDTSL